MFSKADCDQETDIEDSYFLLRSINNTNYSHTGSARRATFQCVIKPMNTSWLFLNMYQKELIKEDKVLIDLKVIRKHAPDYGTSTTHMAQTLTGWFHLLETGIY